MVLTAVELSIRHRETERCSITSIDVYITARCNRRCAYCFLSDRYLDSGQAMSGEQFDAIVRWATNQRVPELTLLGGEPSLHRSFVEFLHIAASAGLRTRVVTNGSPRFRKGLSSGRLTARMLDRVAVSLDTLDRSTQDRLRGPGALDDALQTIAELKGAGIAFDMNVTASQSALRYLPDTLAFADREGARRVNIHWPSSMGRGAALPADEIPTRPTWSRAVQTVRRFVPTRSSVFAEIERGYLGKQPLTGCAILERTNLQVFPDGQAFLCGLGVDDDGWSTLRLDAQGLRTVRPDGWEAQLRNQLQGGCESCPAVQEAGRACIYDKVRSTPEAKAT